MYLNLSPVTRDTVINSVFLHFWLYNAGCQKEARNEPSRRRLYASGCYTQVLPGVVSYRRPECFIRSCCGGDPRKLEQSPGATRCVRLIHMQINAQSQEQWKELTGQEKH